MANWLTKAVNNIGKSITGKSDFNIWHNINQIGAGVGGGLIGAVQSIPTIAVGAVSGFAAGGVPGAIAGGAAAAVPGVVQGASSSVTSYNIEHGYAPADASQALGTASGALSGLSTIAGGIAANAGNEKVAQVAGIASSGLATASTYVDGVKTAYDASGVASGGTALGGGVTITYPSDGSGKIKVEALPAETGWKKTYIPITDDWAKTTR